MLNCLHTLEFGWCHCRLMPIFDVSLFSQCLGVAVLCLGIAMVGCFQQLLNVFLRPEVFLWFEQRFGTVPSTYIRTNCTMVALPFQSYARKSSVSKQRITEVVPAIFRDRR